MTRDDAPRAVTAGSGWPWPGLAADGLQAVPASPDASGGTGAAVADRVGPSASAASTRPVFWLASPGPARAEQHGRLDVPLNVVVFLPAECRDSHGRSATISAIHCSPMRASAFDCTLHEYTKTAKTVLEIRVYALNFVAKQALY